MVAVSQQSLHVGAPVLQAALQEGAPAGLEKALTELVKSNVLATDDKVAVGTIRRCVVHVDGNMLALL